MTQPTTEETCFNRTEADERKHLAHVTSRIGEALEQLTEKVGARFTDLIELKTYLQESKADMDHVEKVSVRQSIDQMAMVGEHGAARKQRLEKLCHSPYFGRIDVRTGGAAERAVYIGMHSFHDDAAGVPLVHDWRAPISSVFYDFETGDAHYDTPEGRQTCRLERKRQYKIEKGELVFMLETSLNIHDDVLQRELSRASDDKMKNIVATIQRDQNAIIRDEQTHALIIQGAAGSGKTSIALHRIAFLLYRFKDTIRSSDILIISPNKVFAHYISQVLPELGEEMIRETTMEQLAAELLEHKLTFQTFADQVAALLHKEDARFAERIRFKAAPEFLDRLDEYARHIEQTNVTAESLTVGRHTLPAEWIAERFQRAAGQPFAQRLNDILQAVMDQFLTRHGVELRGAERAQVRTRLKRMFRCTDLPRLYKEFHVWLGRPELFKPGQGFHLEYADVFPLIHLKLQLEGAAPHACIKHLVVDEMQDYAPVQYRVLARLFPCRKTILGDRNQSVNPLSSSAAEGIRELLPEARCMFLNKSYRSTLQITELAQHIHRNPHLEPVERHGEPPVIHACRDAEHELEHIRRLALDFLSSDHQSLGIICKRQDQAAALHAAMGDLDPRIRLLDARSTLFSGGVIITTAHLAKGLEFDRVIVPHCTAENYSRPIDRHMLYVGCTRAMHRLHLTHAGPCSPFLGGAPRPAMETPA